MFQKIESNLFGSSRREQLLGQEYIVSPVVMIVSGVWKGTMGALFYPTSELAHNTQAWNGMPLTLGHPPTTARTPAMIDEYAIGYVYSVRVENERLIGEAWFNIDHVSARSSQLLSLLVADKPIEVSTGLFLDQHNEKGTKNGKEYNVVARNYRPDHLAILLDQRGACSVKDGCGIYANAWTAEEGKWLKEKASKAANCECESHARIEPLLKPTMDTDETSKLDRTLTRSKLLEVANVSDDGPLRMPCLF